MKKRKILKILFLYIFLSAAITPVFAANIADVIKPVEYSQEFKNYLQLPEEERQKIIPPSPIEVLNTNVKTKNPVARIRKIGSGLETKYSLRDVIGNKLKIKNQGGTNACWAFSILESLETRLGLENKSKAYDFSERHMNYATTREFANGAVNDKGVNRKASEGGTFQLATAYLTNGTGAIDESQMPFVDNSDTINISEIQNKTVTSQVYDTVDFPSYESTSDTTEIKKQMKEHIKTYGSIAANIHGAQINTEYYNNETVAIYCDDIDHGVSIIGWNDEYPTTSFNQKHQPKNPGAWIIKNTWGTEYGDEGYMYLSYEDINVYTKLFGITKAADKVDYENIYQYDGETCQVDFAVPKLYLGNVFNKKTTKDEYINQVSIYVPETYTCKVYVNPKGRDMSKNNLQQIELKAGATETFNAGYHTLEFLEPVKVESNDFAVVIEIQGTRQEGIRIDGEAKIDGTWYDMVTTETKKCYLTYGEYFDRNDWLDCSELSKVQSELMNLDLPIKAFTVSKVDTEPSTDPSPSPNPSTSPTPEAKLENSDLSKVVCNIKKLNAYMFTSPTEDEYILMDVEVNRIDRNLKNNTNYEYYYYLSSNQSENNITDWVKVKEKQTSDNKISFTVDTRDISNFDEIASSDTLYLYIKEVAKNGNQEKTAISKSMVIDNDSVKEAEVEMFIDNVNVEKYFASEIWGEESSTPTRSDDTQATTVLPKAGVVTIIGLIIIISGIGIVVYIKYKRLSKYIK